MHLKDFFSPESIKLEFVMPRGFSAPEREKLERAAAACPIKRSLLPEVEVSTDYRYPTPVIAS